MYDNSPKASASASGGVGFTGLLTIVFIVLKLIGVIDWPWVWVLSPIWISILLVIVILVIVAAIIYLINRQREADYGNCILVFFKEIFR